MKIIVFLGAPGSGKGTQAKRLAENLGLSHFSTGDMLRSAIREGTQTGKQAKTFIDRGELVPDSVMIELIRIALSSLPANAKAILDGFPRTVAQASALDTSKLTEVNTAISFEIPEETLIKRLTGRRVCNHCGESFHVLFMPSKDEGKCDKCGNNLIQRPDDREDVVKRRLEVFEEQNSQLLKYYKDFGKLLTIDADQPVNSLQRQLSGLIE